MANCCICRNQNNESECNDCMHREDLADNFVEMSNEEIERVESQRKLDELAEWLQTVEWEKIEFAFKENLAEKFSLARRFASREPGRLYAVYCSEDGLIASNGRMGVVIPAEVSTELVGKSIIDLLGVNEASILRDSWLDTTREKVVKTLFQSTGYGNAIKGTKEQLRIKYYTTLCSDKTIVQIAETVFLDKEYWGSVMALIEGEEYFEIFYSGKEDPVLVIAKAANAVIYPMRVESDVKLLEDYQDYL